MSNKENTTKYTVLGMLSYEAMSGYDIKKYLNEVVNHVWNVSFGQIYPLLKIMENEKLVRSKFIEQDGKPDKKIYSITKNGLKELSSWLKSSVKHDNIRNELLLKIGLNSSENIKTTISLINDYKEQINQKCDFFNNFQKIKHKTCDDKNELLCFDVIADYIGSYLEFEKNWCNRSIKRLKV